MIREIQEVSRRDLQAIGEVPIDPLVFRISYRYLKRGIDIGLTLAALVALLPVLLLVALAIKLGSRGPLFYHWQVLGRGGRPFEAYKFGTMVVDTDHLKKGLWNRNEMTGPVFKLKHDPRVTRVGRILRAFSIDELPQLWSAFRWSDREAHCAVGGEPMQPLLVGETTYASARTGEEVRL